MSPRKLAERTKTFTAVETDSVVEMSTGPMKTFALQAKATGWTAWSVVLEVSLNGTGWETILTHDNTTGDDKIVWTTAYKPGKKARLRLVSASGGVSGQSLAVSMLGMP